MSNRNIILDTDSYKCSMFNQLPPGTETVYSYIESRGGDYDRTVFFGLQGYIKEVLLTPITQADIDLAEEIIPAHGEPFNRAGWEYILNKHGGYLPLSISSVAEGTLVPVKNVLATVYNTDPACYWLTTYLETALLRAVWYPTTVATNSWTSKQIIRHYLEKNGDPGLINFKLHDFGARGVSSMESAGIGGAAHLVNFLGTDTISGLLFARKYYNAGVSGFSIPAMEHSTVTSWGRENEVQSYRNMLRQYGRPGALLACVSDSYDIFEACRLWGTELKQEVIDSGATVVIRPDSGDPAIVVPECARILESNFGSTMNSKGYRVLRNVRIIQGDGIEHETIRKILWSLDAAGFSADNVAFGQGGALVQKVDRDTCKFAMKCSAIKVAGEWRDVYKDPITDIGKRSKRGRLMLVQDGAGYRTQAWQAGAEDLLQLRYQNGKLFNETTFEQVRERANRV
jgi:nicotinamide phosphoribosyltransferase